MLIFNQKKQNNYIFQELGITLWKLRCPAILDHKKSIKLWVLLKFLLISDSMISLQDLFVQDVIRSMRIDIKEVCVLTVSQLKTVNFPMKFFCHCWWIGVAVSMDFHGICLYTPSLSIVKCNIQAKRDLWRQISLGTCRHV